ncbi:WSC-domain-containing protein [Dichomitus squalens LYAD-421 SS1]|uniref:WSC-domain-containing protein n=2 Tax=Dichomitus squalens TaxID=114155 RepID=A0A4V2JZB4_9APHY|nr:WSC-domain-containing protein [Dichomitus squalens LYAD-421 SS1]EJF62156.1 WSC-domain-containing protein [Dichomitus squalens LYAD-421 SS1]TBU23973.1 WSC-domain-containing protein [Dichomitus squalens]TBU58652.1 WSC-domain-containing protein [Dichomitus squalens]
MVLPLATRASTFNPPTIPLNWSTVYACAVDVPSRVIADDVTTQYTDNTPASCIERCDADNSVYAGVEFSNECHCGTGLVGTPTAAPTTDCNMACTGDETLSCGGSFRIQIYKSPALAPGSWTGLGCFVDTPTTPAFGPPVVHTTFASNLDFVDQCIDYCQHVGYPFAGVEDASDCQCSFGFAGGVVSAPITDCNSTCPLPPGEGREFCGGVQRLDVFQYDWPGF